MKPVSGAAKLKTGKKGKKNRADSDKSIKEEKIHI
jgi:hypothetical protein